MSLLPADHPLASGATADSPLIAALEGRTPSRRPVWFMRQAGRSLPEYREVRKGIAMLDSCLTPDLASEITLQPVRRYDVDAAIYFSDIVVHIQHAEERVYYALERLWSDCPVIDMPADAPVE